VNKPLFLAIAALVVGAAHPGIAQGKKWTCEAKNLVIGSYSGGETAHIQLRGYSSGNSYPVKKSPDGTVATGVTGDGTAFTCKSS
jgi:hypothetical protein